MRAKILAIVLGISMLFAVIPAFAIQPPVTTDKYYVGTIGQPRVVDPAVAYDTASGELIFNVYETLITFNRTSVKEFLGLIADQWWISPDRLHWTFHIRDFDPAQNRSTTIKWHPWTDRNGAVHANDYVDLDDVEYSFEREMVQDMSGSPAWMLYLPLTGTMGRGYFPDNTAWITAINNAVTVNYAEGNVTLNLNFQFPQAALLQILAQTWGSIVHKEFAIEYGCWNGTYDPAQAYAFRRKPDRKYSPLDLAQLKALAPWLTPWPANLPKPPVMCGTGPFKFVYWYKERLEYKIVQNPDYWGPDGVANFTEVYVKGVPEWSTRKMMFLAGEFDSVAVPRLNMLELLKSADPSADPLDGITCFKDLPTLIEDNLFFIFNVTEGSPYLGTGSFPNGIPYNFFANFHVRNAFAHVVNYTTVVHEGWYDEAVHVPTWWVRGLEPDYENYTLRTMAYTEDLALAKQELKAAMFTQGATTKSVWDWGFTLTITYNLGNDQRKLVNDLVVSAFQKLNADPEHVGTFTVINVGLDWPVILDYIMSMNMPMTQIGWLADFADADNWARPYMHGDGDWAYFQVLNEDPNWNMTYVNTAIDDAIRMPDDDPATPLVDEGYQRNMTYQALQSYYHDLIPSIPTVQALGRRWQRDWVQGYYYNVLGQGSLGNYFYIYWKAAAAIVYSVDLSAGATLTNDTKQYPLIQLYKYGMSRGYNATSGQWLGPAKINYTFTFHRLDNAGPLTCFAAVAFRRTLGTHSEYPNQEWYEIGRLEDASFTFTWYENKTFKRSEKYDPPRILPTVPYPTVLFTHDVNDVGNWTVYGEIELISGNMNDTDLTNNLDDNPPLVNADEIKGDIQGDGTCNIFDAIMMSEAFGATPATARWDARVDLVDDLVIDIFDCIVLAGTFGQTIYTS